MTHTWQRHRGKSRPRTEFQHPEVDAMRQLDESAPRWGGFITSPIPPRPPPHLATGPDGGAAWVSAKSSAAPAPLSKEHQEATHKRPAKTPLTSEPFAETHAAPPSGSRLRPQL